MDSLDLPPVFVPVLMLVEVAETTISWRRKNITASGNQTRSSLLFLITMIVQTYKKFGLTQRPGPVCGASR
jgi:hypothetical protein